MYHKDIPIAEFRREGFMQEVNRRFLHPLGLALECIVVDEEGWGGEGSGKVKMIVEKVADALASMYGITDPAEARGDALTFLDTIFPPGSQFLSGVWDCRDDAEGVLFGTWDDEDWERVGRVRRERLRRAVARAVLFRTSEPGTTAQAVVDHDLDVEPVGYVWRGPGEE